MWYFSSPQIIFGDGALGHLQTLVGQGAFIVSDETLARLGFVDRVCAALPEGMRVHTFTQVEPEPSFETVQRGAEAMRAAGPDWVIALGGGSVMDAAKAMWVLYERPDLTPDAINPIEPLGLRQKARLAAIPTTTGTGSEATWAIVLTDSAEKRKLGLGSRENLPDLALLDPELIAQLPARLLVDTALDALTHAVEGFTSTWHNDFSDGQCLNAARMILKNLPLAYSDPTNLAAREKLQNAATIAGMGFGNAMAALAHGMGHALGAVLGVAHGRAVALFLPYTIEYVAEGGADVADALRYAELAEVIGLRCAGDPASGLDAERAAAAELVRTLRALYRQVGQPLTLAECGITRADFASALDRLVDHALTDSQTVMSPRVPDSAELRALFEQAF